MIKEAGFLQQFVGAIGVLGDEHANLEIKGDAVAKITMSEFALFLERFNG